MATSAEATHQHFNTSRHALAPLYAMVGWSVSNVCLLIDTVDCGVSGWESCHLDQWVRAVSLQCIPNTHTGACCSISGSLQSLFPQWSVCVWYTWWPGSRCVPDRNRSAEKPSPVMAHDDRIPKVKEAHMEFYTLKYQTFPHWFGKTSAVLQLTHRCCL